MEDFKFYSKTNATYPIKSEITKEVFANFTGFIGTQEDINKEKERLNNIVKERVNKELTIYNAERNEKEQQFKDDLFEEFGVSLNPKKEKAYALAYDDGHSYGYSEIYNSFSKYVELIID